MTSLIAAYQHCYYTVLHHLRHLDGLAPLALRLYLVPVMWLAGTQKISNMPSTIEWFGNSEWGLGLPMAWLLAPLAAYTEALGALLLLLGFAVRWISIPLMGTMLVAAITVHWGNGWAAIADSNAQEVAVRLGEARDILREHGNYRWLTEKGNFVILNNGIEFAVTYFVMLLTLFFTGGGRYVSVDYYLSRLFPRDPA